MEEAQRLYRSRREKIIAGVCGGLGNYWRFDPTFLRLIVLFLAIVTGFVPFLVFYLIAWLVIPLEPVGNPAVRFRRLYRSKSDTMIAGICGGIAQFLTIDSSIVRLLVIVIGLVTAIIPMMVAYIIGWSIIPREPEEI